jgi:hypothetical protein
MGLKKSGLFKRNVIIDLNYKRGDNCFVNLADDNFGPMCFTSSNGSIEIFNPFLLQSEEISAIFLQPYKNQAVKKLTMLVIDHKMRSFVTDVLPAYRQLRMILEKKPVDKDVIQGAIVRNEAILMLGIGYQDMCAAFGLPAGDIEIYCIIQKLTMNLISELERVTDFLHFFHGMRQILFSPFSELCDQLEIADHYQLSRTFTVCVEDMKSFLMGVDINDYLTEFVHMMSDHTTSTNKTPIYVDLLNGEMIKGQVPDFYESTVNNKAFTIVL